MLIFELDFWQLTSYFDHKGVAGYQTSYIGYFMKLRYFDYFSVLSYSDIGMIAGIAISSQARK
jgi:hypothetical protein